MGPLSLSKNPGVDKGPQPLMFNPALTTCASERMKTQRFSYFVGFAARERMREAKPVKLKKVAFSHFFDTLDFAVKYVQSVKCDAAPLTKSGISIIIISAQRERKFVNLMRKLTVIISLIVCALLVFGCAKAPEQPAAPEEQEASRPDDSEPPMDSGFTWDDGTAEDMEGHIIYPDIQLNFKEDGRVLEFTGEDLSGNAVDSKELFAKVKVTMINVWGTFCSPCIMEMPDLGELSREYADKDFQVIGIISDARSADSDESKAAVDIIERTKADYTHLLLSDSMIDSFVSEIYAIPTTIFVDSTGKVLCSSIVGSNAKESWAGAVDKVLEHVAE